MSLIHLLSLLSAAFLAGLVSLTTEEENIPLEQSPWTANAEILFDDAYLGSGNDIYDLKDFIGFANYDFERMEPRIHFNLTGLHYVRGIHNAR